MSRWLMRAMAFIPIACLAGCVLRADVVDYMVGVHYYPWYVEDFHGRGYLRRHLVPPQHPVLGEYDQRDPEVIARHLAWSRAAGIDFWACSWWGPGHPTDAVIRESILTHPDLRDFKIAILYETEGRTDGFRDFSRLESDMAYLAENCFAHPNYLRIDGRPVLFVYLTRVFTDRGIMDDCISAMRRGAGAAGYDLYIAGDQVFGKPAASPGDMARLDAVFNYDVYGSLLSARRDGQVDVNEFIADQSGWKALADSAGVDFIPSVTPGFNDRSVREGHEPMSRQLTPESAFGSLFRAALHGVKGLADPDTGRMIVVTSWNEWHEDTQIEPVQPAQPTRLDDTRTGRDFTHGLAYEGYGTLYLDILREETAAPNPPWWKRHRD